MPIMNQAAQQYTENVLTSGTITDTSGAAADGVVQYGPFYAGPYRGFAIRVDRESETGTATLDFKLQTYDETTGDITDWLDSGGTNNLLLPQWADGSAVVKWMKVHPEALASDADNVLIVNTANRVYNEVWWAPFYMVVTAGGASTTNVVSISLTYLN
jgi:hypothetical protein